MLIVTDKQLINVQKLKLQKIIFTQPLKKQNNFYEDKYNINKSDHV